MTAAATWHAGQPDPLCAICQGSGSARVRAQAADRGARRCVVFARVAIWTVELTLDAHQGPREGDRLVPCPSCTEEDPEAVEALEKCVIVGPVMPVREAGGEEQER